MAAPPSQTFEQLFAQTSAQGAQFDVLTPPEDGAFFGFLSKADFDEDTQTWDILFEVVNAQWLQNVVFGRNVSVPARVPRIPALLYHLASVEEAALLKVLGLPSTDFLAEGSWYQLSVTPGGKGSVTGDLYDPDIDTVVGES